MGLSGSNEYTDVLQDAYLIGSVTVGTLAIELKVGGTPLANREKIFIYNAGPQVIYIGNSNVTTTNGLPVFIRQHVILPIGAALKLYARTSAGSSSVVVHEVS